MPPTEYERTAYCYPKNDKSATAGYASLVAYKQQEERLSGTVKTEWHAKATDAGVKFAQAFPEHPDSAGVLTRAAEEIFAARDLPRAIEVSQMILARQPPVDSAKQRIAWTIIAQSNYDLGEYAKAEPAYLQARELAGTRRQDAHRSHRAHRRHRVQAGRGEAEGAATVSARWKTSCAWRAWRRIRRSAPQRNTMRPPQLINLKQWDRAIGVLEGFRRDYPEERARRRCRAASSPWLTPKATGRRRRQWNSNASRRTRKRPARYSARR